MTPLVADSDLTLYVGDVRDVLRELEDESVHCVVTSPPYWGLRDYAVDGQLGLEPTPDQYVENMVGVFREVRRVLRRDGTCWLNIGDSYAGSGPTNHGGSGSTLNNDGRPEESRQRVVAKIADDLGQVGSKTTTRVPGLKPKDLVGIPWRLAFALQQDGWYLRAEIIWAKPNPMPESVTDRPTKAHEQVFLLTRSSRYFYDADAVREPHTGPPPEHYGKAHYRDGRNLDGLTRPAGIDNGAREYNAAGRNLRSVWEIPTEPFPQAHFATYPQALVERCVKAGTSEFGACQKCGAPFVRLTAIDYEEAGRNNNSLKRKAGGDAEAAMSARPYETRMLKHVQTRGWEASCDCGPEARQAPYYCQPAPCVVLDPFIGSGTTALVARRLGRKCIGIELSPDYAHICLDRTRQLSLLAEAAQ